MFKDLIQTVGIVYLNSFTVIMFFWRSVILLPVHPASFAHKFLFQRVPASPGMQ